MRERQRLDCLEGGDEQEVSAGLSRRERRDWWRVELELVCELTLFEWEYAASPERVGTADGGVWLARGEVWRRRGPIQRVLADEWVV